MILIADSGSTKTDWCLADRGMIVSRKDTQGINPFHQDEDEINRIIIEELLPVLGDAEIDEVVFYGSGCRAEKIVPMHNLLSDLFPNSDVEINSDLIAAARAVCGRNAGIACILGTGSNSCFYDGMKVVMNTPPLGYILGDEGSGAVLGRLFINALYKGELPPSIREEFTKSTNLSLSDIIENVKTGTINLIDMVKLYAYFSYFSRKNLISYDIKSIKSIFFIGMNLSSLNSQYCDNVEEELSKIAIEEVAEDMNEILKYFNF